MRHELKTSSESPEMRSTVALAHGETISKRLTIHLLRNFIRNSQCLEVGIVHRCIASPGT